MIFFQALIKYYGISLIFIVLASICYWNSYDNDTYATFFYVCLAYPFISILKYAFGYLLPDSTFKRLLFYLFR